MNTFIIAEAGVNHNGSLELAKQLVQVASECGADAVKFQTFKVGSLVTKSATQADYQVLNTGKQESQYDMLSRLELNGNDHLELFSHCRRHNIEFMSTPFDSESIQLLTDLGVKRFKVPSGEITNYPYLRMIGAQNKKVILSTGMATLSDIEAALCTLIDAGMEKNKITLLHATTDYPTSMQDVNLRAMRTIAQAFQVQVGYSDHTCGVEVPTAAVALGASVIEKHFTLDKTLAGPDHKASLDPNELEAMICAIRNIEIALGDGFKMPISNELKNKNVVRKSIVAAAPISKGQLFTDSNLVAKRPGTGISPMKWNEIIGRVAIRDFAEDELIEI